MNMLVYFDGSVLCYEELLYNTSKTRALLSRCGNSLDESRSTFTVVFLPDFLDDQLFYLLLELQLSTADCVLSIGCFSRVLFVY